MRLATKFMIICFLLSAIPLGMVAYLSYDNGKRTIEQEISSHLQSINSLTVESVHYWLRGITKTLEQLASRPLLIDQTAVLVAKDTPKTIYEETKNKLVEDHLYRIAREPGDFFELFILRPSDGFKLATTDKEQEGKYREDEPYFKEGRSKTFIQNIYYNVSLQRPLMTIATPIKDKAGNTIGVLAGHVDLDELATLVKSHGKIHETEDVYLVNKFNFFVTEPRFGTGYALKKAVYTEGVAAGLAGKTGIALYNDYRGTPVIGAYQWIPELEMVIITEIYRSEALIPINNLRDTTGIISLIIILLAILTGYIFIRNISRPVSLLTHAVTKVSKGDLEYRVPILGKDEVGQFAAAFNDMTTKLKSAIEEKARAEVIATAAKIATETIEGMIDSVILTDLEGKITQFNRAAHELFGYGDEVIGELLTAFIAEEDVPKLVQAITEVVEKGSARDFQCTALTKDGRKLVVLGNGTLRKDKDGKLMGIIVAVRDITELRQMQEKLINSERLSTLGQFSGSISHELRNPLGVIDSSVYYLQMKLKDADEKVQEHLERIKSSVTSATSIIESILNLTRMKAPELARVDLAAITADAIATTRISDSVKVVPDFPQQEILIEADREQLRMAFKNIIKNAVEAMDGEGTLTITIRKADDGHAEASFADTGPGIAPENLDRVFQPLFSTKAKGIGFGLAITKMIIDKHGGSIEARSESGRGAVFMARLPLYLDELKGGTNDD